MPLRLKLVGFIFFLKKTKQKYKKTQQTSFYLSNPLSYIVIIVMRFHYFALQLKETLKGI